MAIGFLPDDRPLYRQITSQLPCPPDKRERNMQLRFAGIEIGGDAR